MSYVDNLFSQWYNRMLDKGFLLPTANVALMKMSFKAAYHAGFFDCSDDIAQMTGEPIGRVPPRPFWYAPEN